MTVNEKKCPVEVLSPAGSFDIMKAVIAAGADAVYLGGNMFGARAFANNFNKEELIEAIEYAHIFGRKIYLTVNTLVKQKEIKNSLINYLTPFYEAGLDAAIVQDMGVFRLVKENFPDMDIHASTQMTQTGIYGSRLLKEAGASRIVTSREMSLKEIKSLHDEVDVEIESFVHGALCYCYSGQCLLSSFNGTRSGNRGRCAQPCRMPFDVYDKGRLINDKKHQYALSPKDMCALEILPDVIESGVYSLKIEGRMKNVTYAAGVTALYRKYVDMYLTKGRKGYRVDEKDIQDLMDIYNRGSFTTGYYNSSKGSSMMSLTRPNHMGTECLKVVSNKDGRVTFTALKDINKNDVFEVDSEHSFESGCDLKKNEKLVVNLPRKYPLYPGRIVNRMNNARIRNQVENSFVREIPKINITMHLETEFDKPLTLHVHYLDNDITVYGENVGRALKAPAKAEDLIKNLKKTGNTYFTASEVDVKLDDNVFVPVGWIKDIRRRALEKLENVLRHSNARNTLLKKNASHECISKACATEFRNTGGKAVHVHKIDSIAYILNREDVQEIYPDYEMFFRYDNNKMKSVIKQIKQTDKSVYIMLPHILRLADYNKFENLIRITADSDIDGYICRNLEEIGFLADLRSKGKLSDKLHIITDSSLYIFNTYAKEQLMDITTSTGLKLDMMTLPYELTSGELQDIDMSGMQLIVYGNIPLMISTQCVRKTYDRCDNSWNEAVLKGARQTEYTVKSRCAFCYSEMTKEKLNISGEDLDRLGKCSLRYEFDEETECEIQSVLDGQSKGYTGHFYQGID